MDQFVATFHRFCGDDQTFFVATLTSRPIGLETAFSIQLADKQPVLRGLCIVLDTWATPENRYKRPGIRLGIKRLTTDSQIVFDRMRAVSRAPVSIAEATPPPGPLPSPPSLVGPAAAGGAAAAGATAAGVAATAGTTTAAGTATAGTTTAGAATAASAPGSAGASPIVRPPSFPRRTSPTSLPLPPLAAPRTGLPSLRASPGAPPSPALPSPPPSPIVPSALSSPSSPSAPSATALQTLTIPPAAPRAFAEPQAVPRVSAEPPAILHIPSLVPRLPGQGPKPDPGAAARKSALGATAFSFTAPASASQLSALSTLFEPPPSAAPAVEAPIESSPGGEPSAPGVPGEEPGGAPGVPGVPGVDQVADAAPDASADESPTPPPVEVTRFQVALNVTETPPPVDDVEFKPQQLLRRHRNTTSAPRITSDPLPGDLPVDPHHPVLIVDRPVAVEASEPPSSQDPIPDVESPTAPVASPAAVAQAAVAQAAVAQAARHSAATDARTPGSALVLPANPLHNLSDESLEGFVDCTIYEETANVFHPATDGPEWNDELLDLPAAPPPARTPPATSVPAMPFDAPPDLTVRAQGDNESLRVAPEPRRVAPESSPADGPAPDGALWPPSRPGSDGLPPFANRPGSDGLPRLASQPAASDPSRPATVPGPLSSTDSLFAPLHDRAATAGPWLETAGAAFAHDYTPQSQDAVVGELSQHSGPVELADMPSSSLKIDPALAAHPEFSQSIQPPQHPQHSQHPAHARQDPQHGYPPQGYPYPPPMQTGQLAPLLPPMQPQHTPYSTVDPAMYSPYPASMPIALPAPPVQRQLAPWQRATLIAGTAAVAIVLAFVIARRVRGPGRVEPAPASLTVTPHRTPQPRVAHLIASDGPEATHPVLGEPRGAALHDPRPAAPPAQAAHGSADVSDDDGDPTPGGAPVAGSGPCRFTVATTPAGSIVRLDDQPMGPSPITIDGTCDKHKLDVSHARYQGVTRWVTLAVNQPQQLEINLPRPIHAVTVTSTPPGAVLSIDGHRAGTTPTVVQMMGFATVSLTFTRPGFPSVTKKVYSKLAQDHVSVKLGK
ncbi:MAG TPA: PEGA domain-containing protein [Kofleriaceae bacterium]|nr:PEGA domain-containing protein [Kofleriaceae bacterium]